MTVEKPPKYHKLAEEFIYESIMVPHGIPGVQAVFAYKGKVIYDEAFGFANIEE